MAEPTDNTALAASQVEGWVAERRRALRLAMAAHGLEDARREPRTVQGPVRARERRERPTQARMDGGGSDDPHIDYAHPRAREVRYAR